MGQATQDGSRTIQTGMDTYLNSIAILESLPSTRQVQRRFLASSPVPSVHSTTGVSYLAVPSLNIQHGLPADAVKACKAQACKHSVYDCNSICSYIYVARYSSIYRPRARASPHIFSAEQSSYLAMHLMDMIVLLNE